MTSQAIHFYGKDDYHITHRIPDIYLNDDFVRCHPDNYQKIINFKNEMVSNGGYQITPETKQRFIQAQSTQYARECAQVFTDNIHYISIHDVLEIVGQLVIQLYNRPYKVGSDILLKDYDNDIYFVVGAINKSNYYINVVAYQMIINAGFKIPKFITSLANIIDLIDGNVFDCPIIYFDDASYSGSQVNDMFSLILTSFTNRLMKFPNFAVSLVALNSHTYDVLVNTQHVVYNYTNFSESNIKLIDSKIKEIDQLYDSVYDFHVNYLDGITYEILRNVFQTEINIDNKLRSVFSAILDRFMIIKKMANKNDFLNKIINNLIDDNEINELMNYFNDRIPAFIKNPIYSKPQIIGNISNNTNYINKYSKKVKNVLNLNYLQNRVYPSLKDQVGLDMFIKILILFAPSMDNMLRGFPIVALYLDHKIADEVSTFKTTLMYGPAPVFNKNYFRQIIFFCENVDYSGSYDFLNDVIRVSTELIEMTENDSPQMDVNFLPLINNCHPDIELLKQINYFALHTNEEDFIEFLKKRMKISVDYHDVQEYLQSIKNVLSIIGHQPINISLESPADVPNNMDDIVSNIFNLKRMCAKNECPKPFYKNGNNKMACDSVRVGGRKNKYFKKITRKRRFKKTRKKCTCRKRNLTKRRKYKK